MENNVLVPQLEEYSEVVVVEKPIRAPDTQTHHHHLHLINPIYKGKICKQDEW